MDVQPATPASIVTSPGESQGEASAEWDAESGRYGWMLQWTTNPADSKTYSEPIACMTPDFTLDGRTAAEVVHFRVAAIDPAVPKTHTSAWSTWVACTVR